MKLSDYFPTFGAAADTAQLNTVPQRAAADGNNDFEQILTAAEQREEVRNKPKDDKPVKPKDKPAAEEPERQPEDKVDTREKPSKEPAAEKTADGTTAVKPEENVSESEAETQTLEKVAEILQVPVEALSQMLASLNLKVSDLTEPSNVAALLQVALNAPSPAALLTIPQFAEMYEKINKTMEEFAPVLEEAAALNTEQTVTRAQALQNMQVTADENGETQVTFNAEQNAVGQEETAVPDAMPEVEGNIRPVETAPRAQTTTEQQNSTSGGNAQSGNPLLNQQSDVQAETNEQQDLAINTAVNTTQPAARADVSETVRAAAASVADADDVMGQIMSRIRTAGDSFSEIRLTLKPENLGDIALRVTTQNGIVTAQFVAESQRIKEIIEANFNQLRDVLNEQGIAFSQLNVSVRQDGQGGRTAQFEQGRQSSRARIERIEGYGAEDGEEASEAEAPELTQGNVNIRV